MTTEPKFQIISTLRSDPLLLHGETLSTENAQWSAGQRNSQLYMLVNHHRRMVDAAQEFMWAGAIQVLSETSLLDLQKKILVYIRTAYSEQQDCPFRVRLEIDNAGKISFTFAPTPVLPSQCFYPNHLPCPEAAEARQLSSWTIYMSGFPTPKSLYTKHKTTYRPHYDELRNGLDTSTEVLCQNEQGEVSEGTICTPYFWRNGKWVTPAASCGGNIGTTRRWALQKELAAEGIIKAEDVELGEVIWLSNGVRGFGWGVVKGRKKMDAPLALTEKP